LRNNVYFQHGQMCIYPNTYIVLLAESAQYRKGMPIEVCRRLLSAVKHTKVFSGTASIQAILDVLSQDSANKMTGIPIKGGSALITADELAAFFVADPRLIPLLTDIWSPRAEYEYLLRSQNSIKILGLCPSLLAASNDQFLREVYDSRAVYGGLLGRTFLIKPSETRPANSLMEDTKNIDEKPLIESLNKIKELRGRVRFTIEAIQAYNKWYTELYEQYKVHPDKTGVIQRMHVSVIKLAIIQAAARCSLEITEEILNSAILDVLSLKQNYSLYIMSSSNASHAQVGTLFLASMLEKPTFTISRKEFLAKNWQDVIIEDFDKIVDTLVAGGMIEPKLV